VLLLQAYATPPGSTWFLIATLCIVFYRMDCWAFNYLKVSAFMIAIWIHIPNYLGE
jgi:hypothetical protein